LPNRVFDYGDDRVVGDAAFPRTVVVHEIAQSQRALLFHS
jgi:hypothetical protein